MLYFLIIDLEATCWNEQGDKIKANEMEIIEIGAVLVDAGSFETIEEFQSFVKPVRNPVLSDFCKHLTHISQEDVDNAPNFKIALQELNGKLIKPYNPIFCSWGNYDKNQLLKDCSYHNIPYPFSEEHINIKELFCKKNRCRRVGLRGALEKMGLEFQGNHHRALDDARNIVRIFKTLAEQDKNIPVKQ